MQAGQDVFKNDLHFWGQAFQSLLRQYQKVWEQRGFLPLRDIYTAAGSIATGDEIETVAQRLMLAFNGARPVQAQIDLADQSGDKEAGQLGAFLRQHRLSHHPCRAIPWSLAMDLERQVIASPEAYLANLGAEKPYPAVLDDGCLAFDGDWARETLAQSRERLRGFIAGRRTDTAVLVGNGPSLAKVDLGLLEGQDVYISNYAIRDARLHRLARGVAVSNRFVARQAPYLFQTTSLWAFHPLWLGDILRDTPQTVFLNALGGSLFFSEDAAFKIAWHSTVTFFWLQILYSAGYRKVCLVGVDNAYRQKPGAREGDLIQQTGPDENHFDPDYFRGKVWQAADTARMAETYRLAKHHYAANGREIVNCTIGGSLEVFRRASLADELPAPQPASDHLHTVSTQEIVTARRDVIRAATQALVERSPRDDTMASLLVLKPDDPARVFHERVHAFLMTLEARQ